jgi:hypothetical protein
MYVKINGGMAKINKSNKIDALRIEGIIISI